MINKDTKMPEGFPEQFWGGFHRYVVYGTPAGSFLMAFIEGDFHEMCRRGGEGTVSDVWGMVLYLHNHCPTGCYGSAEHVREWLAEGGLSGLEKTG